jgi:hypothetical protein
MTLDTMNEMILGFAVILGSLFLYSLTLFLRIRRESAKNKAYQE